MNGIHDMGGQHGFGRVRVEPDEPVFHERWEARVFGMGQSLTDNLDAGRHAIEQLDPVAYLQNGYYGRWLASMEQSLLQVGVLSPGEIEARMNAPDRQPAAARASDAAWTPPSHAGYARAVEHAPVYRAAQAVRTRNHQPAGHTRLPAYVRCKRGTIEHVHPAMVYPDDHAHGRGENPQYLYTVRFDGAELWGIEAETDTVVFIDLFEPYLVPA